MEQSQAPLWDALIEYKNTQVIPFHTPGHKLRPGVFPSIQAVFGQLFSFDPSDEIEELALDHDFDQVLDKAQQLAADLFGAIHTFFLVNGTSGGLHTVLAPLTGNVVVPRFSHQSIYSGIALSGATPIYVPAEFVPEWGIPVLHNSNLATTLANTENIQAVVLTNPTYYGTGVDLPPIAKLTTKQDILLIIDEAHGGHFKFSSKLPASGLEAGADFVVQSTHKVLGSLTGSSMLHCNNGDWLPKVAFSHSILQTTSPSLIMLAILDEVRRTLAERGSLLIEQSLQLAAYCQNALSNIDGVELFASSQQLDPTKLVVSLRKLGLTGFQIEELLRKDYGIQVEMSDYYSVVILITLGDTKESIKQLVEAFKSLAERHSLDRPLAIRRISYPPIPAKRYSLRESLFLSSELVTLAESTNRTAARYILPYPPGVPLVVPGEVISQEVVEYVKQCLAYDYTVRGITEEKVWVIKE